MIVGSYASAGAPGVCPTWTSSRKMGMGTALEKSNIWFTLSYGIINEVYFPHIDIANTRDIGLIVTDGKSSFSEEKRNTCHEFHLIEEGIPAYHLINTHKSYRIEKKVITDPKNSTLLQEIEFIPLEGKKLEDYKLYVLIAPHIGNSGFGNTGWIGEYKGIPMLFAERVGITMALGCSAPFTNMSCSYVGEYDSWHDLYYNKSLTQSYSRVEDGNIELVGEIDLKASNGKFVLALGLGNQEAGIHTRTSLIQDFNSILKDYIGNWKNVQMQFMDLNTLDKQAARFYRMSTSVLKIHENRQLPGTFIESLSIPWNLNQNEKSLGKYHVIWPRIQVETAQALLAAGTTSEAIQTFLSLICLQEMDGHWAQCHKTDGTPYRTGLQLDETALPILLADLLKKHGCQEVKSVDSWEMIKKASCFLIEKGPVTEVDRWEENGGYTPYTLATEISALLVAADFFEEKGSEETANYLRETADWWNENIERWLYVSNTDLAHHHGVEGYYARVTPAEPNGDSLSKNKQIIIKNRPEGQNIALYDEIVCVDALALVRFGLRSPDDPKILSTIKVIDALLKTETSKGVIWHRYNEDGYGEREDGSSYDGHGIGRGWPLLLGERAHYELAKGNKQEALKLCQLIADYADPTGLIPEQIWDAPDIPEKGLYNGQASGSAQPLVWAHAEYITLLRSLSDGMVFNMPSQTIKRYLQDKVKAICAIWRPQHKSKEIPQGKNLRIQCHLPAKVHWTCDDWKTSQDSNLKENELKIYYVDLPVKQLKKGDKVIFTFLWSQTKCWEGKNYEITIV